MMVSVVVSALVGMALGQRFKVLILVPTIGFTLLLTIAAGIMRADGLGEIVMMAVAMIASLQIGYLAGTGILPRGRDTRQPHAGRRLSGPLPARRPADAH
jgi:hypothetical protein